jgi:hypothetical protein
MTDSRKPSPKAVQDALAALTPEQRRLLVRYGVRRRSEREFLGLPFYDIAMGPDPMSGQARGHAKGVIAIGDVATGIVALGGIARGVFALGGVALGLFSFGGLSIGLLAAVGGAALSLGIAFGGGALGTVAVGGGAVGHYAVGGAPNGTYVAGPQRVDPEVVELFASVGLELPMPAVRPPARAR